MGGRGVGGRGVMYTFVRFEIGNLKFQGGLNGPLTESESDYYNRAYNWSSGSRKPCMTS